MIPAFLVSGMGAYSLLAYMSYPTYLSDFLFFRKYLSLYHQLLLMR